MTVLRIPCPRLTFEDAIVIHMRLMRGEFQSRIAADFDVNQGRIADVKAERLHPGSRAEALRRAAIAA